MQIKSIKVSNIFTFEDRPLNQCDLIEFTGGLNLLIGPNGTGKSNFIEIINTIFKKILFVPYLTKENLFSASDPKNRRMSITKLPSEQRISLPVNRDSKSESQQIELVIELNEQDQNNINFLITNKDSLNKLITTYTDSQIFNTINSTSEKTIKIIFSRDISPQNRNKDFSISTSNQLILYYLKNFYLIQEIIKIANEFENKKWSLLTNTFALIGSNRNYVDFNKSITWLNRTDKQAREQFKTVFTNENNLLVNTNEPVVYSSIRYRFSEYLGKFIRQLTNNEIQGFNKKAIDVIKDQEYFKRINTPVKNILGLDMHFVFDDDTQQGNFYYSPLDRSFYEISILSSGEKSMLQLIYSLYGYDLKNGLLLIDEPEIHLHPQWQERYLRLILEEIENRKLQVIVVTHSPFFIDEKTIHNVHRFFKNNQGFTSVTSPDVTHSYEKHRLDFLISKNIQKCLFSDRIILVTSEHLETFFRLYYKNYIDKTSCDKKLEFLYIHLDSLKYIASFLHQFNIKLYLINPNGEKIENVNSFDLTDTLDKVLDDISSRKTQAVVEYFKTPQSDTDLSKKLKIEIDNLLENILNG